jgi:hypothetical protein
MCINVPDGGIIHTKSAARKRGGGIQRPEVEDLMLRRGRSKRKEPSLVEGVGRRGIRRTSAKTHLCATSAMTRATCRRIVLSPRLRNRDC